MLREEEISDAVDPSPSIFNIDTVRVKDLVYSFELDCFFHLEVIDSGWDLFTVKCLLYCRILFWTHGVKTFCKFMLVMFWMLTLPLVKIQCRIYRNIPLY